MNTKKMATAAAIVLEDGTATHEPLYSGKDLMELYPTAKKIILFSSAYEAAMFAQKSKRVDDLGTIHGNWDNDSTIGLVPCCGRFHVVDTEALEPERNI